MKTQVRALAIALGLFCAASGFAQTTMAPPAKANAAASAPAPTKMPMADSKGAAMGGGAGKVWVNTSSKIYHCEGSKFYGKTKIGEYMTEAEAKAKGNHAVKGKGCAK